MSTFKMVSSIVLLSILSFAQAQAQDLQKDSQKDSQVSELLKIASSEELLNACNTFNDAVKKVEEAFVDSCTKLQVTVDEEVDKKLKDCKDIDMVSELEEWKRNPIGKELDVKKYAGIVAKKRMADAGIKKEEEKKDKAIEGEMKKILVIVEKEIKKAMAEKNVEYAKGLNEWKKKNEKKTEKRGARKNEIIGKWKYFFSPPRVMEIEFVDGGNIKNNNPNEFSWKIDVGVLYILTKDGSIGRQFRWNGKTNKWEINSTEGSKFTNTNAYITK